MSSHLHSFEDENELTSALSVRIADQLQTALQTRGTATLAVSGGSTPVPLFKKLRQISLPWEKVHITLVDERWVPPDHADSNERLVKMHLLQDRAQKAQWLSLKSEHSRIEPIVIEALNRKLAPMLPFDALVLGMGKDGHTASFFPDAPHPDLQQALSPAENQWCMAIASPTSQYPRMTLTLPAILQSQQIYVHIQGDDKKAVLDRAMADGAIEELPIRAILRQNSAPVAIYYCPQ
ncbi:MAG: 6-phosphogluconolactonase [Gammaproteobacteria bacterium]